MPPATWGVDRVAGTPMTQRSAPFRGAWNAETAFVKCSTKGLTAVEIDVLPVMDGAVLALVHCPACGGHCEEFYADVGDVSSPCPDTVPVQVLSVEERVRGSYRQLVRVEAIHRRLPNPGTLPSGAAGLVMADVINDGPLWTRLWPLESPMVVRDTNGTIVECQMFYDFRPTFVAPRGRAVLGGHVLAMSVGSITTAIHHDHTTEPSTRAEVHGIRLMTDWIGTLIATGWVSNCADAPQTLELVIVLRDAAYVPIAYLGVADPPLVVPARATQRVVIHGSDLAWALDHVAAVSWQVASGTLRTTESFGAESVALRQYVAADGLSSPY